MTSLRAFLFLVLLASCAQTHTPISCGTGRVVLEPRIEQAHGPNYARTRRSEAQSELDNFVGPPCAHGLNVTITLLEYESSELPIELPCRPEGGCARTLEPAVRYSVPPEVWGNSSFAIINQTIDYGVDGGDAVAGYVDLRNRAATCVMFDRQHWKRRVQDCATRSLELLENTGEPDD